LISYEGGPGPFKASGAANLFLVFVLLAGLLATLLAALAGPAVLVVLILVRLLSALFLLLTGLLTGALLVLLTLLTLLTLIAISIVCHDVSFQSFFMPLQLTNLGRRALFPVKRPPTGTADARGRSSHTP